MNIYQKLRLSMRWNAIESIIYQILLAVHQLMFFKMASPPVYGTIGIFFALVYLGSTLISLGFESAITPFFIHIKSSQKNFVSLFIRPVFTQLIGATLVLGIVTGTAFFWGIVPAAYGSVSLFSLITMGLLSLHEALRRIVRTTLNLFFQNKMVASVESGILLVYLGIVWTLFALHGSFTHNIIFLPLLCTSIVANGVYCYALYTEFKKMPATSAQDLDIPKRLVKSRLFNVCNVAGHLMFSSNFLIPLCALVNGPEIAGIFKLISHWCYLITPIVHKVFGLASQALFAETKHFSSENKIELFAELNKKLVKIVVGLFSFIMLLFMILQGTNGLVILPVSWYLLALFVFLLLSESFIIVYEKFCIAEEQMGHLLFQHACTAFASFLAIRYMNQSLFYLISSLLVIRLGSFLVFPLFAMRSFRARFSQQPLELST